MFFCVFPNAKRWFRVRDHKKLKPQKFSIRGRRNVSPPRMRCHRHILIPVHVRGPHIEIAPKRFAFAGEHGSGSVPGGVPRPPDTRVLIHAVRPGNPSAKPPRSSWEKRAHAGSPRGGNCRSPGPGVHTED